MNETLMFEVAVSEGQSKLKSIQDKLLEFHKQFSDGKNTEGVIDFKVKIAPQIEGLNAIVTALSKIGDTPELRKLRQEVQDLNNEFAQLAKGAGGKGDFGTRAMLQEVERLNQEMAKANAKAVKIREAIGDLERKRPFASSTEKTEINNQISDLQKQLSAQEKVAEHATNSYNTAKKAAQELIDKNKELLNAGNVTSRTRGQGQAQDAHAVVEALKGQVQAEQQATKTTKERTEAVAQLETRVQKLQALLNTKTQWIQNERDFISSMYDGVNVNGAQRLLDIEKERKQTLAEIAQKEEKLSELRERLTKRNSPLGAEEKNVLKALEKMQSFVNFYKNADFSLKAQGRGDSVYSIADVFKNLNTNNVNIQMNELVDRIAFLKDELRRLGSNSSVDTSGLQTLIQKADEVYRAYEKIKKEQDKAYGKYAEVGGRPSMQYLTAFNKRHEISALYAKEESLREESRSLKYHLDRENSAITEQAEVSKKLKQAKEELANANKQLDNSENSATKSAAIEKETIDKLTASVNTLNTAAEALKNTLGSWNPDKGSIATLIEQFGTLRTQIEGVVAEWKRLAEVKVQGASQPIAQSPINIDLSAIEPAINALNKAVKTMSDSMTILWEATKRVNEELKATVTPETIKQIAEDAATAKKKTDELAASVSKTNAEMKSVAESKGSEATLYKNLDKVDAALVKINAAIETVKPKFDAFQAAGLKDDGLEQKYQRLIAIRDALEGAKKNTELMSKAGAINTIQIEGGIMALGEVTKELRSSKGVEQLAKDFERLTIAAEQSKQAMAGLPSMEAKGGGVENFIQHNIELLQRWREVVRDNMKLLFADIKAGYTGMDKSSMWEMYRGLRMQFGEIGRNVTQGTFENPDKMIEVMKQYRSLMYEINNARIQQSGAKQNWAEGNEYRMREAAVAYAYLNERIDQFLIKRRELASSGQDVSALDAMIQKAREFLQIFDRMRTNGFYGDLRLGDILKSADFRTIAPNGRDEIRLLMEKQKEAAKQQAQASKEQANAAKQAEKDNEKWANSMDFAKTKANELRLTIEKLEAIEKKGLAAGVDVSSLSTQIAAMRQNLNTLYGMAGGAKMGGTAQDFVGSSAFKIPVQEAKQYADAVKKASANVSTLTSEEQRLAQAINHSSQEMKGQSQVVSDLKMLATQYIGVWGAQGFLQNIIQIGGQLEMQRLSIGAILGDMAKATELFDRIKNLAIKSPFGVVELDQMTKQLSAYGFEYNELFDMTKRLADISAATGTSVDRLALALGHVRSEAALSGYTLRQFSMANIPLAKKLSEELTRVEGKFVSVADVRKRVRTKDIGYEQVLKVLKDLTDEGGMFYNAQEIMSESVKARFKNLKDSMDIMYGEIAESRVGSVLKEVAQLLTTLTRHWQELGAVIIAGSASWAINRMAMLASNKAIVQGNLTLGRYSAAQLEMLATTRNLTREQLLAAVATKKLAVADAEAAGAVLGLSRAQLQHVANTGKVASAMNMATIATSRYTMSQLRFMASMRGMNLGWLANSILFVTNGFKAASVAALGFMKAMWPMLAISAIVEVFMSAKREAEAFADAANYVGQAARNMMKDIDDAMKSVTKGGKPVDTEALREAVNTMKDVLENSEFYTAEQQKQVDRAQSLSEKYDILLKQMKEMREEAEWQANSEGLVEKILTNTGRNVRVNTASNYNNQTGEYETVTSKTFGTKFFNDSLQENIEQVNKSNAALQSAIQLMSEYQGVIANAIEKNHGFGLSLEGKSWQEQVKMIAQSGHWDEFVASVENAGSRFQKTADRVKDASGKVRDDWQEIVNDDVQAIRLTLMQEWGMTEDEITAFAKNNERTMRWLVDSIAKSLGKLGVAEAIIDEFKQKLLELFGVASSGKPTKRELTEYEKQTDLGKRMMRNVINYNKNNGKGGNGVTTVKEINEITGTGENQKSEVEVTKALKERAQKSLENMNETKRLWGETSQKYKDAKQKYEHDLNLAQSNGITEDEIRSGKYKNKKDSGEDKNAKEVRERVRVMKEAADAFQYWRDKVGEQGAWSHVLDEFGDVLGKIGITADNVQDLRGNLQGLDPLIKKIKDPKVKLETEKERDKEIAQLNRKDYEQDVERFTSKVQTELDALTRAWDIFNSVRESTGNVELAVQLSGADYANGQTRNLADALKAKIEKDFAEAGVVSIPFDINYDDESIEKDIQAQFFESRPQQQDGESNDDYQKRLQQFEKKIKGFTEQYKKWRDLQRDVVKSDISTFSQLLSSAQDYESQIAKIDSNLEKQKESIDNMEKPAGTTDEEWEAWKKRAKAIAEAKSEADKFKLSSSYINLMNNSLAMTGQEIQSAAQEVEKNLNAQLKAGTISAEQFANELEKVHKIVRDANLNSFFGKNNEWNGFAQGGVNGAVNWLDKAINKRIVELGKDKYTTDENGKYNGNDKKLSDLLGKREKWEGVQKSLSGVALAGQIVTGAFEGMANATQSLANMFEALGNEGAANFWSDVSDGIKGVSSIFTPVNNIVQSAMSGNIGGIVSSAISAPIDIFAGPITAFAQLHDKRLQRQIEALQANNKALEANTEVIKQARERTLGYDDGELRRQYANYYAPTDRGIDTSTFWGKLLSGTTWGRGFDSEQQRAMYEFYNKNSAGNGYEQELANLKEQRKNYMEMYAAEEDKKDSSSEALEEYKQKIAELDDQIQYFVQDLANELWGIDIKGWADQIGDALWTAFENGEDALEAFHDTAKDIVSDVAKRMMNLSVIEPMFQRLQKALFGEWDPDNLTYKAGTGAIKYDSNGNIDMPNSEQDVLRVLGQYFGTGGELEKTVDASEQFYDWVKQITGIDFGDDESTTASKVIQGGFTENETGLLLSYVNSMRADLSMQRQDVAVIAQQYMPTIMQTMTQGNAQLVSINQHVAEIERLNSLIVGHVETLRNDFHGLKTGAWKIPMA